MGPDRRLACHRCRRTAPPALLGEGLRIASREGGTALGERDGLSGGGRAIAGAVSPGLGLGRDALADSTYGCRRLLPIRLSNSVLAQILRMSFGGRTGMLLGALR